MPVPIGPVPRTERNTAPEKAVDRGLAKHDDCEPSNPLTTWINGRHPGWLAPRKIIEKTKKNNKERKTRYKRLATLESQRPNLQTREYSKTKALSNIAEVQNRTLWLCCYVPCRSAFFRADHYSVFARAEVKWTEQQKAHASKLSTWSSKSIKYMQRVSMPACKVYMCQPCVLFRPCFLNL